ncbi:DUF1127 domain-containing protein [Hyphomicrobiales bacterium]|jgi:uncharacterized protein YjiS (DUF1127 family)|uniref:DUF1127 domain-containing protein n=1 Tax=Rhizobium sp. CECT 9324 TaxID=2845820 RepID=UPI000DDD0178
MVTIDTIPSRAEGGSWIKGACLLVLREFGNMRARWSKRRGRLALLELSESQLRDIGITREQALYEASKVSLLQRML